MESARCSASIPWRPAMKAAPSAASSWLASAVASACKSPGAGAPPARKRKTEPMRKPEPCTLETPLVRLEPMTTDHVASIEAAARDGELWNLRITFVPAPGEGAAYVAAALQELAQGNMLPFVVRDVPSGKIIGCTSYHDIVPSVERLEIGATWYGKSWQRSHVNTTCKL